MYEISLKQVIIVPSLCALGHIPSSLLPPAVFFGDKEKVFPFDPCGVCLADRELPAGLNRNAVCGKLLYIIKVDKEGFVDLLEIPFFQNFPGFFLEGFPDEKAFQDS